MTASLRRAPSSPTPHQRADAAARRRIILRRRLAAIAVVGVLAVAAFVIARALADDGSGGQPVVGNPHRSQAAGGRDAPVPGGHQPRGGSGDSAAGSTGDLTLTQQVGQHVMAAWRGSAIPPAALLKAVRSGHVGGVVLFSENAAAPTAAAFARTARTLQRAAAAGHQPSLLIATDQEGGLIRRLPGPPVADPIAIADPFVSGRAAGRLLRSAGITVDQAPIADLPSSPTSFEARRAMADTPGRAGARVAAFVRGLHAAGVAATVKHYPGLGDAAATTDLTTVAVTASRARLDMQARPFAAGVAAGAQLVMISSADYPALDPASPAVLSAAILRRLRASGFDGVIISDAFDTPALAPYGASAAVRAVRAGVDMLLYGQSDGANGFATVLDAARHGQLSRTRLAASTQRILALKRGLDRSPAVPAAPPARAVPRSTPQPDAHHGVVQATSTNGA